MARPPITKAHPWTPSRGQFAGRTFTTEREYRDALAKTKGHRNWYEQQRTPKKTTRRSYGSLRAEEREARARALDAIGFMRRRGLSLSAAARIAHTTSNTVAKHVGSELLSKQNGRRVVTKADRLYRPMRVISREGEQTLEVRGSRQATRVVQHRNAVQLFLDTGDEGPLQRFKGMRVAGALLETDPAKLEELGRQHALSSEGPYDDSTR